MVGTFGDQHWVDLAKERAIPSALACGVEVAIHAHADSLDEARNRGLRQVDTEYVCFLDADDELEPGYFDAIALATGDLRVPCVRYVEPGREWKAHMPRVVGHVHDCTGECLEYGNWLVVGTVARTQLLRDVGGWRDFPVYEDYDLWARCWRAGANIERVPESVYRAHVRKDSRNRGQLTPQQKHAVHQAIARANGLPVPV